MKYFKIESMLKNKKLIGYGAGPTFLSTRRTSDITISYTIDDREVVQWQYIDGIPICSAKNLKAEKKDEIFIIIFANTPKAILTIWLKLNHMGFKYGEHYIDCSFPHYESMNRKLEKVIGYSERYEDFFKTRMMSLYSATENLSHIAVTWLFMQIFKHVAYRIEGDVAECGVYKGWNALISLMLAKEFEGKNYNIFDSFEGFPKLSELDPLTRKEDFVDVEFSMVNDMFYNFSNVNIHKVFLVVHFIKLTYLDSLLYMLIVIFTNLH